MKEENEGAIMVPKVELEKTKEIDRPPAKPEPKPCHKCNGSGVDRSKGQPIQCDECAGTGKGKTT